MDIYGADVDGVEGRLVRFRTVTEEDARGVHVLGLAGKVVREGVVRAQKAIETLPGNWSAVNLQGYTFTLSPPETPKNSSGLDLPVAIMLLVAGILQRRESLDRRIEDVKKKAEKERDETRRSQKLEEWSSLVKQRSNIEKYRLRLSEDKARYLLIGTFDITTGSIEAPHLGMLGMISAVEPDFTLIVPEESEVHAALMAKTKRNVRAYKAENLEEVWNIILGITPPRQVRWAKERVISKRITQYIPDLKAVKGISQGKKAMMVALAGGHNILLVGPPGYGKTMLSTAAIRLLPAPSQDELFEINKIYSAKGNLQHSELVLERPFQQASNNITKPALFGGGRPLTPGLVSLAHRGVLLLDEINLFPKPVVEELRVPLDKHSISVQRVDYAVEFPCRFILVAAMNPCRCGFHNHYFCPECNRAFVTDKANCPDHPKARLISKCKCSPLDVARYKKTLSRPLLERIDLKVLVYDMGGSGPFSYSTRTIRNWISKARAVQKRRYEGDEHILCNADVPDESQFRDMHTNTKAYLKHLYGKLDISPRTEFKILKVAQTIADLRESTRITQKHIDLAVDLMGLSNPYFEDF